MHVPSDVPECILDDSNFQHYYTTPSKKKYPSVTTILSATMPEKNKQGIKKWREDMGESVADYIFKNAGVVGREAHNLNECYLLMTYEGGNFQLLSHAHHENFKPYLDKINNIYGIEKKLFSDELELAGMADCIAEYDGVLSIIDYKTKRSEQTEEYIHDYYLQTTAYAMMWEELTGTKINQIVILVSSEQNTMQEFIANPMDYVGPLKQRLAEYNK